MKRGKRLLCAALSLCLFCFLALPGLAAEEKEPYTYTVRILSGKQGTINGQEMLVIEGLHYDDRVRFDVNSVIVNNGSKYYCKGIRESGKDNNTVGEPDFRVTGDQDYVVAYGVWGKPASYTVNYVDGEGNTLAPSETYYGNVGDKPVIAYLYIDGYRPEAYNLTGTLSADEAENVFTFVYTAIPAGQEQAAPEPAGTEEQGGAVTVIPAEEVPAAATPGGGEENGGEQGEETQNIDEEGVPLGSPEELKDIDDEEVPLAGFLFNSNAKLLGIPVPVILIAGAAIAGVALWYVFLFRKRRKKESRS